MRSFPLVPHYIQYYDFCLVSLTDTLCLKGSAVYVASASYCGECEEDISFPEGAKIEVLEKNPIGWWVVR